MREPWPYFREFPAIWAGDTSRLRWSLEDHGAVAILRRYAWLAESTGVPRADLPAILRVTPKQLARLLPAIESAFAQEGELLVDLGLREQKAEIVAKSQKAGQAARYRHSPKSEQGAERTQSDRSANDLQSQTDRRHIRSEQTRAEQQQQQQQQQERSLSENIAALAARGRS